MKESMVVNMAYHANDPSVGLSLHLDSNRFKMYVGDTGLFITLAFWDKAYTDNQIYQKLLTDKLSVDLGYVYENVVAQMLKASGHELYYYTFPTDSGKHNYEVDFLIADDDKISPIEVKSSGYKTHASLDAFCTKYSSRIRHKYLLYTKDFHKEQDVLYVPVYMAGLL
jgi:predicted AAA+ superfamily ATPase